MIGVKRILMIDDEPGLADVAAEYLRRINEDFEIQTVTAAPEGLSLVKDGDTEFDCIVSDYNMPSMDGLELFEAVRGIYEDLPFILYTGRGSEEIASEAISAGVTDYLQKERGTDHYEVLANRIENAISQTEALVELRETGNKIEALHQTAARAATCSDRTTLCELAVEAAEEILAFDICDLSLCEGAELVPKAVSEGTSEDGYYRATPVYAEDNLAARAFREGETMHINDLQSCEAVPAESDYRSSLTIPIDDHGVFQAVSRELDGFDERDRELAELLLAHVAAALDRIGSEEELRDERDKFAALFRNIPHAIGVGKFRDIDPIIHEANPTFESVFGWKADEITGESIDDLIVPQDATDEARAINEQMRDGKHVSGQEVRRYTADGTRDFLLHTVQAPNEDADGFVIYTDITQQKRRERELQHQNERLDEFVSVLSHDLRNPLEVADGRARLLQETCDSDHIEPLRKALDRVEERVSETVELAEQGRTVWKPEPMCLSTVVEEAWQMVETRDASLALGSLPEKVSGDRSRVLRLFENLFRNAVEHGSTADRDSPDVAEYDSTNGRLSTDGSGDGIIVNVGIGESFHGFYVEDDGTGVDGDHDRLFERGYTTSETGTELGLRIIKDIAESHGWLVRATDSEMGGLRVEVHLRSHS
ncbi:response regulator [Haladaptatus sp. NG-SE-30]